MRDWATSFPPAHESKLALQVGPVDMSETLRVAIVGGGVCGLTCAIALLREGVDVHVYEAAVSVLGDVRFS